MTEMDELQKLYEERSMKELEKQCRQELEAGQESARLYGYFACAAAARNDLFRFSLREGMEAFEKAAALCQDAAEKKWLYERFTDEAAKSARQAQSELRTISMTKDVIKGYRECMQVTVDAMLLAIGLGREIGDVDLLPAKKETAVFMVWLCAAEKYEIDVGKNLVKGVYNAPEEIRVKYTALYDELTEEIKRQEPEYVPAEIQREFVNPRQEEPAPAAGEKSGPGFWEKILRLLEKRKIK